MTATPAVARPNPTGPPPPVRSSRPRLPGLHLASIKGRAWADRAPLLLSALVVGLATLLAAAVPQAMISTADDAVQAAVAAAGPRGALVVTDPFEREEALNGTRIRPGRSAELVNDAITYTQSQLVPGLAAVMRPALGGVTSTRLNVTGHGPGRTFQLGYVSGGGGAKVEWLDGGPPKSMVPADQANEAVRKPDQKWPVQVGLSQETASQLKAKAGSRIQAVDSAKREIDIRVTGIFRPLDRADPAWQSAPELITPVIGADGTGTRIELAGLMSADSLPDGRLALEEDAVTRTITFVPEPERLRWDTAEPLAIEVVKLKATSSSIIGMDGSLTWESSLELVLQDARTQVLAAAAQASVLLVGLITSAALILLLAADLLVRRRAVVLAGIRMRGASLAGIGGELLIESIAVTLAGTALGLLLGRLLAGGLTWTWLLPVVLVAILSGPVLGMLEAARATRGRQAPANRSARRTALRTGQLRRVTVEVAILLATAGAFSALHQRGVIQSGPDQGSGDLLAALAPTLGAITGALILLRLLPLAVRLALARATRARGSLPLFAAARAAATAARPLPFVILITSTALLTFALAVSTTERDGQAEGSWRTVGADARLDAAGSASLTELAQRVAQQDGVDDAMAAHIADSLTLRARASFLNVRLIVVDPDQFARLLAGTPLPPAPQLGLLKSSPAKVPVLLRTAAGTAPTGQVLEMSWDQDTSITVTVVGGAPAVGEDDHEPVMLVDGGRLAAAGGVAVPNTVWANGPRAGTVLTKEAGPSADVTLRSDVLHDRQTAPLAAGLQHLAEASVAVLLLWGLLSVLLGAATSAPARGETLARLRTLGLRPGEARRVATGELLPPVLLGAVAGVLLGVLLAHAVLGRLALRLITGQAADPALVLPWVIVVPVLILLVAVLAVVRIEASLGRRERLGEVLRAGNT